VLDQIFDVVGANLRAAATSAGQERNIPTRLHSLLVDGLDQIASSHALARDWELVAPLPFGRALNTSINAHPQSQAEAQFLLTGDGDCSPATQARATTIGELAKQAKLFELADQDELIADLFLAKLGEPHDVAKAQAYSFAASERVALAAQVMIEQSDILIGVWDGATTSFTGGTGHTIALTLATGTPVVWIDARAPENWRILYAPEALPGRDTVTSDHEDREEALARLIQSALRPEQGKRHGPSSTHLEGLDALNEQSWATKSAPVWHIYRRTEAVFGGIGLAQKFKGLSQTYETPDQIATGSARKFMDASNALPVQQGAFIAHIETSILRRFAWADGISARLSDLYRGGMTWNFVFSAFAITGGIAYLPFATSNAKWIFALFELVLLLGILGITFVGQRHRWHGRWFETRRVAEYLRHSPILLLMGVARAPSRWPKGSHTSWPEYYARHSLRSVGLPQIALTSYYLRDALTHLLLPHVTGQADYHRSKAKRLAAAHHHLDQVSELLFKLAVASVSCYLALKIAALVHIVSYESTAHYSKLFTFLGVLFPTFGGAIAGIRFFGDFERFSAISDVTAQKLDAVAARINLVLQAPPNAITYAHAAELAHATDDIVIAEIENWQAVFSGKHISVPV
jgi:hypothetical protein